jgi:fatty-acyl-CoA synthase
MDSTMQDAPLMIRDILRHGRLVNQHSTVTTITEHGSTVATFAEVANRVDQLAGALRDLGVKQGDRVGTFCWNNQTHLEAYLAIPSMGAVLHTLNIRLFPEQLAYVINHAEDKVIIVDASLVPLLARVWGELTTVESVIVAGDGPREGLGETLDYETLLAAQSPGFDYPDLDERSAAAMCYTSGTTGNPKGVVYSHRSTWIHSLAQLASGSIGLTDTDSMLLIVPMFHANGWGTPYSGFMAGTSFVMPQQYLQGVHLARIIEEHRPTLACGVPTIWNDLLQATDGKTVDFSSLRAITAGGSNVPQALFEAYDERFGVPLIQGWGMTETSPLATFGTPPRGTSGEEAMHYRIKAGKVLPGVEVRVVGEDGTTLPNDGQSIGEFEIRGPWVTGSYYLDDDASKFHDGWLRTGDVGTLDAIGYMTISDRSKDVIKSGGEWISSVELEGTIMAHPSVFEAAVVAVPDARWDERPLACVVLNEGAEADAQAILEFLGDRVAKWWLPERWTFIASVPKTSVGKFDKKVLRAMYERSEFDVIELGKPSK